MTPTDKYMVTGNTSGFNDTMKVTPIAIATVSGTELPPGGINSQLFRRKSILVQNTSSGTLYVGGENVGHSGDATTCSGMRVESGDILVLDAGRVRVYGYNEESYEINIKLMEIA